MDPITIGLSVAGLAMSAFGGMSSANASSQMAGLSQQKFGVEQQEDNLRQQSMEVSSRRNQMEILRNTQRQRSMALASGQSQTGSTTSSGVMGGQAEVTSEGGLGLVGNSQALQAGNQMFGYTGQINTISSQMSGVQSQMATDQGIASMGGSLMKAGPVIGNMFKGFSFGSSGGNYSGTPGASNTGNLY